MNVVNKIEESNICCGCGVCVGICPNKVLSISWDEYGEYRPNIVNEKCRSSCSLCKEVCPVIETLSIDSIGNKLYGDNKNAKYDEVLGYHLNNYIGYVVNEGEREKSASGGLATWTMCNLLDNKQVDKVITVGTSNREDRLFDFKICATTEQVKECRSSYYYPVEISSVIEELIKEKDETTYAIMALPCSVYALRKAQEKYPKLKKKIKFIFSLVCGQLVNKYCTELLSVESGIKIKDIDGFNYRKKRENVKASEFYQVPISKGKEINPHVNTGFPYKIWSHNFFTLRSCSYCEDIFGELADAVFMDAWLPEYMEEWKGTTIAIVRNPSIDSLYKANIELQDGAIIKDIDVDSVKKSQNNRIVDKTKGLSERLAISKKKFKYEVIRRRKIANKVDVLQAWMFNIKIQIEEKSKISWKHSRNNNDLSSFWKDMKCLMIKSKVCMLVIRITKKIKGII